MISSQVTSGDEQAVAPGPARASVVAGVAAAWGVGLALFLGGSVPLLDTILLVLLLVVMPGFALVQASMLEGMEFDRLSAYWSSIATLWVLGATAWLVGARDGGIAAIGIVGMPFFDFVLWSFGLGATGVGVMLLFRLVGLWRGVSETAVLGRLLPRNRKEKRVFVLLSLVAGFGEEIAYRGYAIPMLAVAVGLPWSVVLTSVVFGALHAYQGRLGMVRTAVMGAILAGGFLGAGSLLPVIVAHALVDIVGGLVIGDWFVEDSRRNNEAVG
ncbi:MAG: CPBP family intramembrane glutamic endopeptidase [Gemmatimonadota bacterium]|nr:CPBP family intramembrane glutamic endopeptidase [Gemmatimonadota bacterium]